MGEPTIDSMLVRLAGWHLPGAGPLSAPADGSQALALVSWAEQQRLLGPLLVAVELGEVALPEPALRSLFTRHEKALWWCLRLERHLLHVRSVFEAAGGVDHLVLKGPAIAHLDEGDPSLRSFADLDLLVREAHLEKAVAALERDGSTRPWAERRPGFDRRFAKSVTLTHPQGIELDLHRSLCDGAHGFRIPLDRLFANQESFALGGHEFGALSAPHRLLHAAYHAVLGSPVPRLMSLRDLGGYLTRSDLRVSDVVAEAGRWRGEAVLAVAVHETLRTLGIDAQAWQAWVEGVRVDARERAIVDRQRVEGSTPGRAKLDGLVELAPADRLAYLFALALPSAAHLRSRNLGLAEIYRRRVLRRLRGDRAP